MPVPVQDSFPRAPLFGRGTKTVCGGAGHGCPPGAAVPGLFQDRFSRADPAGTLPPDGRAASSRRSRPTRFPPSSWRRCLPRPWAGPCAPRRRIRSGGNTAFPVLEQVSKYFPGDVSGDEVLLQGDCGLLFLKTAEGLTVVDFKRTGCFPARRRPAPRNYRPPADGLQRRAGPHF